MKRLFLLLTITPLIFITGCASVQMQETKLVNKPAANVNTAIVTFVRPSILFGDGVSVDIWDGNHYIGALGAGKLIQQEVEAGKHIFLGNAENWSYVSADLLPGRQYFIKANFFPGVLYGRVALGVAQSNDPRISEWQKSLKPINASTSDKNAMEVKKGIEIQAAILNFDSGKVTSFSKMKPEDGILF